MRDDSNDPWDDGNVDTSHRPIAERVWYRALLIFLIPIYIAAAICLLWRVPDFLSSFGVTKEIAGYFVAGMLILLAPAMSQTMRSQRKKNLEKFDPRSKEGKALKRRLHKIGYSTAFLAAAYGFFLFFIFDYVDNTAAPDFIISISSIVMIVLIFIAVGAFHLASEYESGQFVPPKWIIPKVDD